MASVTIAWWTAANVRVAWRSRLCFQCYATKIVPLEAGADPENLACPMCHIDTNEDMDPCYVTSFLPSVGRVQLELPTCAPCAAKLRIWTQEVGSKLEDASGGQGPGPQTDPRGASDWGSLGVYPRE